MSNPGISATAVAQEAPNRGRAENIPCFGLGLAQAEVHEGERCKYLTTKQAAQYLHKSVSWLLRQGDIPYLTGRPNTYSVADLDEWFERHKHIPLN